MPLPYNHKSNSSDRIHYKSRGLVSSRGCSDSSLIPGLRSSGPSMTPPQSLRSILQQDDLLRSTFLDSPYRYASKPHPLVEPRHHEPKSRSSPPSIRNVRPSQSSRITPSSSPQRTPQHSPQTSPKLTPTRGSNSGNHHRPRPRSPPTPVRAPKIVVTSHCDYPPRIATETGAALMPKHLTLPQESSLLSYQTPERQFRRYGIATERRAMLAPKYLSDCPKSNINWDEIDLKKMRLSFNPLTREAKLIALDCTTPTKDKRSSQSKPKSKAKKPKRVSLKLESPTIQFEDSSVSKELSVETKTGSDETWCESTRTAIDTPPLTSPTIKVHHDLLHPTTTTPTSPVVTTTTLPSSPSLINDPNTPISPNTTTPNFTHDRPKKWRVSNLLSLFRSKSDSKLSATQLDLKTKPISPTTTTNHRNDHVLPRPPSLVYESATPPSPRVSKRLSRQLWGRLLPKHRPLSVQ